MESRNLNDRELINDYDEYDSAKSEDDQIKGGNYFDIADDKSNDGRILIDLNGIEKAKMKELYDYLSLQKDSTDENQLKEIFKEIDIDDNKTISPMELKKFLDSQRSSVNDYYLKKIVEEFDENGDNEITEEEFITRMKNEEKKGENSNVKELLKIFNLFDANHDGEICSQDLLNLFKILGENFTLSDCESMISFLGREKTIKFDNFFQIVKDEGRKDLFNYK
jgi:Ca2+-binding EF-hand superfamily protein